MLDYVGFSLLRYVIVKKIRATSGREINFFSDSHLAPKFFKGVANSKKLIAIYKDRQNLFFNAVSVL